VNGKDEKGNNVLHLLCRNGHHRSSEKLIDAINLLIQFGIDVHGKDNEGKNVLHFLCQNSSVEIFIDAIKLFIELGVDVVSNGIDARKCLVWDDIFDDQDEDVMDDIVQLLDRAVDAREK
jgi:ankyrin repeat protein